MNKLAMLLLLASAGALAQTEPTDPAKPEETPAAGDAPPVGSADATVGTEPAQASATGLLLAPKIGFFKTTTALAGAFYAGLEVGYVTPAIDHKLAVVLEGDFHRPAVSSQVSDAQLTLDGNTASGAYRLAEREMAFLLSVLYRTQVASNVIAYGGLGPGFYLHQATVNAFGSTYHESEGNLGFQLQAGGEYALGPGGLFLEVHYHFANVDFVSTGKVNVGGFLAGGVGYRLKL